MNLILILLMGTHLYFTLRLGFVQRYIPRGLRYSLGRSDSQGGVSPLGALSTALAATIGTGNIIGISTALALGGPGAIFWCWLTGLLGIATCYAECFLSLRYRVTRPGKSPVGGPMYVLQKGLHKKRLAQLFAVAAVLASFGMGSSVQSHSIYMAVRQLLPWFSQSSLLPHVVGITTGLLGGFAMMGGVKKISNICTLLVPFMGIFYLAGCGYLLFLHHDFLVPALVLILKSALSPSAALGGMAGAGVSTAIRIGISRGLFTNEAGLGSIPMAAASSQCKDPIRQSLVSMTGPFWDTVVICGITGIVLVSSILASPVSYEKVAPEALCFAAFGQLPLWGTQILSLSLILFAFATILGWSHYGTCSLDFLTGGRLGPLYQVCYLVFVYLGAVVPLEVVWSLSDLLNILMLLPNLVSLWLLRKEVPRPEKI